MPGERSRGGMSHCLTWTASAHNPVRLSVGVENDWGLIGRENSLRYLEGTLVVKVWRKDLNNDSVNTGQ